MSFDAWIQCHDALAQQGDSLCADGPKQAKMLDAAQRILKNYTQDAARVAMVQDILFPEAAPCDKVAGDILASLFVQWRDDPPSLAAIIDAAATHFSIPQDDSALEAARFAAIAGETLHDNAYHNTTHFREVVICALRLCHIHNQIADDTLTPHDIALCIAAAATHDLGHDGKGNTRNGAHIPAYLERRALDIFAPLADLTGLSQDDRDTITAMVLVTDISGPISLHKQFKYLTEGTTAGISTDLDLFKNHPRRQLLGCLLSDADLGPSCTTNYSFSRAMTGLLNKENPALANSDQTLIFFLTHIAGGSLMSAAGRHLGNPSLNAILAQAHQNIETGPAPSPGT